jgi:hypothetical protein
MLALVHTSFVPQPTPQLVQFVSVPKGTHVLPLRQNPLLHVKSQLPLIHAGLPLAGAAVQVAQVAPQALGLVLATQVLPLGQNPALHVNPQVPPVQARAALATVGQTVVQVPQWSTSVLRLVSQPSAAVPLQLQNPGVQRQRSGLPEQVELAAQVLVRP